MKLTLRLPGIPIAERNSVKGKTNAVLLIETFCDHLTNQGARGRACERFRHGIGAYVAQLIESDSY